MERLRKWEPFIEKNSGNLRFRRRVKNRGRAGESLHLWNLGFEWFEISAPSFRMDDGAHVGVDVDHLRSGHPSPAQGGAPSKDEINSSFHVAILEEVEASVVTQCVLEADESAAVECSPVSVDPRCKSLWPFSF